MTEVSLRDYVDRRFEDSEKGVRIALESAEKAVNKAEENAEKWRQNANEWRGAMNDREKNFIPRAEVETAISGMSKRVDELKTAKDSNDGHNDGSDKTWAIVVTAVSILFGLIGILWGIFGS